MGGLMKARTVAAVIPGKSRSVAERRDRYQCACSMSASNALTDVRAHLYTAVSNARHTDIGYVTNVCEL